MAQFEAISHFRQIRGISLLARRRTRQRDLQAAHRRARAMVESRAGGSPGELLKSGYGLGKTPVRSGDRPDRVENLILFTTESEGTLKARWHRVHGTRVFELQSSPDGHAWNSLATATTCTKLLTGLPPGTRLWIRVRAIGTRGPGPWSDPAVRIVA